MCLITDVILCITSKYPTMECLPWPCVLCLLSKPITTLQSLVGLVFLDLEPPWDVYLPFWDLKNHIALGQRCGLLCLRPSHMHSLGPNTPYAGVHNECSHFYTLALWDRPLCWGQEEDMLSSIKGLKKSKENILIFWTPAKFPDVPGVEGHR